MKVAYTIPDTPDANIEPGQSRVKMVPINRMVPRSFITNPKPGAALKVGAPVPVRGIAFGGDCGVAQVELSIDGGKTWQPAQLGKDDGKYSFRRWEARTSFAAKGNYTLMVRCTNTNSATQPQSPNWNPAGFMRNVIEATPVTAA